MSHREDYYYNEHDENQVKKILKAKKKKRTKRLLKLLFLLFVFVIIGIYFLSDYSKVQSIRILGNEDIPSEDILKQISLSDDSIYMFVNTHKIEDEIKNIPLVKKATVSKDLFGHFKIEIEEADKIAYCVIDKTTYVIDELGGVIETNDNKVIHDLQSSPRLSKFKDLKFLQKFAKAYANIPELIKNQTSDIIYAPKEADEERLQFLMVNGKIMYLRVDSMVEQLEKFDYEAFMTAYSDRCEFSFEDKYVYMEKCK